MPDEPATRVCRFCSQDKPISEFRRRRRGDDRRESDCRACHNSQERLRRYKGQTRLFQDAMRQIANARELAKVRAAVLVLLDVVGGIQGLADRFRAEWKAAPEGSQQRWWYTKVLYNLLMKLGMRGGM